MKTMKFQCVLCGHIETEEPASQCSRCGGILKYVCAPADGPLPDRARRGMFRYHAALPVAGGTEVTLGEGDTPLVPLPQYAAAYGLGGLYVKCEFMNPTASFKDRAMAVSFTRAKELGIERAVVASAGNAATAAAAYGARAGMAVWAVVPEQTTESKVLQALAYGARVVKTPGGYSESHRLVRELCAGRPLFNVTTTYVNPYNTAGYKTMGYEIYEQLGKAPDWILIPVGAGPLLGALYEAFEDLRQRDASVPMPRLVAVQVSRCPPIAEAFARGETRVQPWHMTEPTIASGLNDELRGYTQDGDYTLRLTRQSRGYSLALPEEEVVASTLAMARAGLYVEPASATGLFAAKRLREQGVIGEGETAVMIATGSGLKNPVRGLPFAPVTVRTAGELEAVLSQNTQEERQV